ncbi:MAG TPA: hypothetical protein VLL08_16230 [Kineosporiaceae bacterium]|nr:hypothetical protein [Kineosporiaceae bacterium]
MLVIDQAHPPDVEAITGAQVETPETEPVFRSRQLAQPTTALLLGSISLDECLHGAAPAAALDFSEPITRQLPHFVELAVEL